MVYLPPVFTETRPEILVAHIERHDFALIVSHGRHGLVASHIPFLVEHRGPDLHLLGHLARPNPQLADLADLPAGGEVMTVFSGPHAYISPSWYASGPAVPTWNYANVHAYGTVRVIDDAAWLSDFLHRLSQRHEAGSETPWRIEDQPADYMAGMVKGIVGYRHCRHPARRQIQAEPEPTGRRPAAHRRRRSRRAATPKPAPSPA